MSRWMRLMTVVLVGLVAVSVTLGVLALRTQRAEDGLFSRRTLARAALQATLTETTNGQVLAARAAAQATSGGPRDPTAVSTMTSAASQQERALSDWTRYQNLAQSWGGAGHTGNEVVEDLGRLNGVTSSELVDAGTEVQLVPRSQTLEETLATQVANDGSALRSADIAWWTAELARQRTELAEALAGLEVTGAAALITLMGGNLAAARASRRREQELIHREADLAGVARANEFEARLQRALEMSATEDRVHRVTHQALEEAVPGFNVEVLLADSSRAHFHRVVETGGAPERRCSVESPAQCPAARRGEVLTFSSNRALDACPYLKEQTERCSSVCVPVSVGGTTIGVVHAAGPHEEVPDRRRLGLLELIARRASDRIGMMRAFARTEVQASTDSLTGLSNRRFLEDQVCRFSAAAVPYAVAFADLDRFKMLNDVHGHAVGDQALRIFAEVLRHNVRPGDLASRYGGEEFVLVLPNCDLEEGVLVLERIRARLAEALSDAGVPAFTASFGLAPGQVGVPFEILVSTADKALLEAKVQGRNRIVVAGAPPSPTGPSPAGATPSPDGPGSHWAGFEGAASIPSPG